MAFLRNIRCTNPTGFFATLVRSGGGGVLVRRGVGGISGAVRSSSPRTIAILAFLLIAGGIGWFYFNSRESTPELVEAPTTEESTPDTTTATEPSAITAPTDLTDAISQLDKELIVIGQDEQSDDDTINL